jgi:hypothetical protein
MQIHAVQTLTVTLAADNLSGSPEWLAPANLFSQMHIHIHDILLFVCHLREALPLFRITINRKYAQLAHKKEQIQRVMGLILRFSASY